MNQYDVALKSVLGRLTGTFLRQLTGCAVTRWHNVELTAIQNRRVDMLGETADEVLIHIELQSTNDAGMGLRMLEYAAAIRRQFARFPRQIVLYVGDAPLRMSCEMTGPQLSFGCGVVDIRVLDSEALIASEHVEDNIIAILTRLGNEPEAVRRILGGIARCETSRRAEALDELMVLAGLRSLAPVIEEEIAQMPLMNDIMDHPFYGPRIRKGREEGLEEGLQKGLQKGRLDATRQLVLSLTADRFGPLPADIRQRIESMPAPALEQTALRLRRVASLDDLLSDKPS